MDNEKLMKNILFIVNEFPAVSETFIENLINQAKEEGHKVSVLCKEKKSDFADIPIYTYTSPPISRITKVRDALSLLTRDPRRIFSFYSSIFRWGGIKSFTNFYSILNYANPALREFDLYHVQFGLNGVPLATAKKANLITGKIVTTFHGYDAFPTSGMPFISRQYYKTLFETGDLFTVNTPYLGNRLIELGCPPNKIVKLPMTIETSKEITPKSLNREEVRLISVGRLVPFKGHEYGLKTTTLLKEKGVRVKYTIIGDGPERSKLEHLIHEYGLQEEVSLTGALSNKEVLHHLHISDIFLMTSITDSDGRCETQGVVTIEAQSVGLPAFGFDSGGVKYTIDDHHSGRVIREKDYATMATAIWDLISDKERYSQMSANAIRFVEKNFSNKYQLEILKNIYQ